MEFSTRPNPNSDNFKNLDLTWPDLQVDATSLSHLPTSRIANISCWRLPLASCLIYAKPLRHPFRAFIEYICGCVLFQYVTVREIRGS